MKKSAILIFLLVILLSLTNCSNKELPIKDSAEVAHKYMAALYNVENFTEYKTQNVTLEKILTVEEKLIPYVTSKMSDLLTTNREIISIHDSARKRQRNISLDNIEFKLQSYEENKVYFNYKAKIKLTNINNKEEYKEKEGQIGLVKVNNQWKVNSYKSFNYPIQMVKVDRYNIKTENLYNIKNTTKNNIYYELKSYVNGMFFAINNTTDGKLNLKFPSSKLYELILYGNGEEIWKHGDEVSSFGQKTVFEALEEGESMVFSLDYPIELDLGKYEYEFYITAEGWENKEHLKGIFIIE